MEVIKLNLIPNGASPVAHASQYDEGRRFRCDLFEGAEVYTLDGTEVLECDIKKPDGNIVTVAVTNTSDSYIAGNSFGEIKITKDAKVIGTLNFILAVERSPLEGGIESDSGIHNLQEQIGEAVAEQYSGEDVIFDDEPTEGHGVGFAVKSGGLKAYIPKVIGALDDLNIDSPAENQAIVWNPITQKWENGEVSTVGSIDDLDDVDTTGKGTGDSLRFDPDAGEEGEWVAQQTVVPLTEQEYEDLQEKQLCTFYLLDDGSPLDYTAKDILYEEGETDTVWDEMEKRLEIIEYHPTTNTVTITASTIGAVCEVFVNRGYNAYDASLQAITGGNPNNFQLVEVFKGSNVTVTKTSGTEFTITAGTELPSSTVYLLVVSGEWTISG